MHGQIRDIDRLLDISEFAGLIIKHTNNITPEDFYDNDILKWAVLKYLENIGEAASQLTRESKSEFQELDWRLIVRARNFYVHEYFAIEWPLVWETLTTVNFIFIQNYAVEIAEVLKKRYSI